MSGGFGLSFGQNFNYDFSFGFELNYGFNFGFDKNWLPLALSSPPPPTLSLRGAKILLRDGQVLHSYLLIHIFSRLSFFIFFFFLFFSHTWTSINHFWGGAGAPLALSLTRLPTLLLCDAESLLRDGVSLNPVSWRTHLISTYPFILLIIFLSSSSFYLFFSLAWTNIHHFRHLNLYFSTTTSPSYNRDLKNQIISLTMAAVLAEY